MWLFVFFDLPTHTKQERKDAASFRKKLIKDGFSMMQFSVYARHCASMESAKVHIRRVEINLPPKGNVKILRVTDKQFGQMVNFMGKVPKPDKLKSAQQLEFF